MTRSDEQGTRPSGIQISEVTVTGGRLRIVCTGDWGYGSEGHGSGALVQRAIDERLKDGEPGIKSIILDYQRVHYEWGDGIIWSVHRAILKGIDVTFYGNLQNAGSIQSAIESLGWKEKLRLRVKSDSL